MSENNSLKKKEKRYFYVLAPIVIYIQIIYFWNLHTILIHIVKFQLEEKTLINIYLPIIYAITHRELLH